MPDIEELEREPPAARRRAVRRARPRRPSGGRAPVCAPVAAGRRRGGPGSGRLRRDDRARRPRDAVRRRPQPATDAGPCRRAPRRRRTGRQVPRRQQQRRETTSLVFGAGDPRSSRHAHHAGTGCSLALESADGRYWARLLRDPRQPGVPLRHDGLPHRREATDLSSYAGPGCGLVDGEVDPTCPRSRPGSSTAARRRWSPRRWRPANGARRPCRSRNGYLVFEHLGGLPDGVEDRRGRRCPTDFRPCDGSSSWTPTPSRSPRRPDGSGTGDGPTRTDRRPADAHRLPRRCEATRSTERTVRGDRARVHGLGSREISSPEDRERDP